MGYRNYANTNGFIVAKNGTGDFTTIAAALTAATSGTNIYISPGTYTENPTLKAGVNLVAFPSDDLDAQVVISGKCSASFTGSCDLTGMVLQTNSDFAVSLTGSNATVVNLINCELNCTTTTGINSTGSNAGAQVNVYDAVMNLATTGIAYFAATNGSLSFYRCVGNNASGSTTNNTFSGASLNYRKCYIGNGTTTSGSTAIFLSDTNSYVLGATNVTAINSNSTAALLSTLSYNDYFSTGTASPITVGASSIMICTNATAQSSNASFASGAGSLTYGGIVQAGTEGSITVTTKFGLGTIGKQDGNTVVAGYLGELQSSQDSAGSSVTINTITNSTSLTPTKGTYAVSGSVVFTYSAGVAMTNIQAALATSSSNFTPIDGNNPGMALGDNLITSTSGSPTLNVGPVILPLNGSTTIFLNCFIAGTSATTTRKGWLQAVRIA